MQELSLDEVTVRLASHYIPPPRVVGIDNYVAFIQRIEKALRLGTTQGCVISVPQPSLTPRAKEEARLDRRRRSSASPEKNLYSKSAKLSILKLQRLVSNFYTATPKSSLQK